MCSSDLTVPRRARAYLLTDEAVADTAAQYASQRPELDEVSRRAIEDRHAVAPAAPEPGSDAPDTPSDGPDGDSHPNGEGQPDDPPEDVLWAALSLAPNAGVSSIVETFSFADRPPPVVKVEEPNGP